jgi:hypothetical protein
MMAALPSSHSPSKKVQVLETLAGLERATVDIRVGGLSRILACRGMLAILVVPSRVVR